MALESVTTQSGTPATVPTSTKIAADALAGGELVQYVKLISGVANDETPVASGANGLYVEVRGAPTLTVQGPAGAPIPVSGTFWPATQPVSGTVAVSNLPATQPVSGTVSVANFPATQPISGSVAISNLPATQPVSGTVTVQDGGGSLTVDGTVAISGTPSVSVTNFPSTQPISGTVAISNLPVTQPISGTVVVTDGGDSLTVDGTVSISGTPSVSVSNFPATQPVSGTFWPANPLTVIGSVQIKDALGNNLYAGQQVMSQSLGVAIASNQTPIPVTGTFTATGGPADNAAYTFGTTPVTPSGYVLDETATNAPTENSVAAARIDAKRAQVVVLEDVSTGGVARRAGITTRGALQVEGVASGTAIPVSGTFWQATQPVSGTFWQATQPISIAAAQVAVPLWGHGVNGAAVPANSHAVGMRAANALPGVEANGDLVMPLVDLYGRQVTIPIAPRELVADATITLTNTTETTLVGSTASEFHDLITLVASNASATVDTRVDFRDTTGGTVRFSLFVPAKATVGFSLPTPRAQGAVNTNWTAQCGTTSADVRIYAQYVRNR